MNLNKLRKDLSNGLKQSKEFGIVFPTKALFYKYTHQTAKYIINAEKVLLPYLKNETTVMNAPVDTVMPEPIPVWVLWWQGEENMPEVVRLCANSLKANLPDNTELVLLDKNNYSDYADIPAEIAEKVNNGIYSITHFSDLLRNALLVYRGGLWIDATVYCARPIPYAFLQESGFWSVKLHPDPNDKYSVGRNISNRMWGSFIQKSAPHGRINTSVLHALEDYMREHNVLAEYFTQNIFIRTLYNTDKEIKEEIDRIPYSNPCIYDLDLGDIINSEFQEKKWAELTKETTFFKLSWKKQYRKYTENGDVTFYGHLLGIK